MSRRSFVAVALLVLALGATLRTVWLTSDPPNTATNGVGVVWHDEGAWIHNARNRALWGVWSTDRWNPVYIAPVFTAVEYAAFRAFGVGTWQARVTPVVSGLAAIAFLMAGLAALSGRRAALLGGGLLATSYVFVMWNRAALMESTMTALIVVSWAAYARAERRSGWGAIAGIAAVFGFFTKASAAFFVAALAVDTLTTIALGKNGGDRRASAFAGWTLGGAAVAAVAIGIAFVLPHWNEYSFYNWQMTVTRKPEYSVAAFKRNVSWLPLVHDFFTWMWPIFAAASLAMLRIVARWRDARPARRLLVLWVLVGLIELVVHDSGNERRYVMFVPALIALAVDLFAGNGRTGSGRRQSGAIRPSIRLVCALLALPLGYLVAGSGVRLAFLEEVRSSHLHVTVVLSTLIAVATAAFVWVRWSRVDAWFARGRVPAGVVLAAIGATMAVDGMHFAEWAQTRQTTNYDASVQIGRLLAPGTLVQGKLANGLSLENRIRPIFIGHDFGNYADRLQRDDVRYILTYTSPSVGFESQAESDMIPALLDHYPRRRIIATLPVNETGGPDRAALIDKVPGTDSRAPD